MKDVTLICLKRYTLVRYFLITILLCSAQLVQAQTIRGTVTDSATGKPLPFASIYIKGTTQGTTTNDQGKYSINISGQADKVICQYVGYQKEEKNISSATVVNFKLSRTHTKIRTVKVTASGEDPAYKIIRAAIKKRPDYEKEIEAFEANCYIKGKIKLDETPQGDGFFNLMSISGSDESVEEMKKEADSMRGIIYLSESYSKIGYQRNPKNFKVKVLSSKVSGSQGAYGFSQPMYVSFYNNNVSFGSQISPRGFISPIANAALRFYKYKLLESYFEDGQWINRIQVIPKRKLEPVFSGEIHIIDNSWRIHSIDLMATKDYELSVLDTVTIRQIHVPVDAGYTVKDQTFGIVFKMFGFGVQGQFVNVFTNYKNKVDEDFFDRYVVEYDTMALKQNAAHWDSIRVIPLEEEEVIDYRKKDSISEVAKAKQDSMASRPFSYKPLDILRRGLGYKFSQNERIKTDPLIGLNRIKYNTVEGLVYELPIRYNKKLGKDNSLYASAHGRYGFSNQVLSAKVFARYRWGKSNRKKISIGGGRYVFQYNNEAPVDELLNSYTTLFQGQNYLKIYQATFGKIYFSNRLFNGLSYKIGIDYQDRNSLLNSTEFMFKWFEKENEFTDNYPTEIMSATMPNNSRLAAKAKVEFQPGRKLIKYPDRIVSVSSRYPVFYGRVEVARPVLGTDASYARWQAGLSGRFNLKLYGRFKYRWNVGGFIDKKNVSVPDFTHFNGNQLRLASPYLNSFQLAPYYANSNTESLYTSFHAEHHFNGLGTNKIPLFRKMKYYLVAASNGYYVKQDNNYIEVSAGLENVGWGLFRFFRVDAVVGYQNFSDPVFGIRLGISSEMFSIGGGNDIDE